LPKPGNDLNLKKIVLSLEPFDWGRLETVITRSASPQAPEVGHLDSADINGQILTVLIRTCRRADPAEVGLDILPDLQTLILGASSRRLLSFSRHSMFGACSISKTGLDEKHTHNGVTVVNESNSDSNSDGKPDGAPAKT
jgi:hypothetical protein